MSSSAHCFDNVDSEELLPPSAFSTSRKLTDITPVSSPYVINSAATSLIVSNVHTRGMQPVRPIRSDNQEEVASMLSKVASTEAQIQELTQELHTVRRENLVLQHSRDAAHAELKQLRTYIGSAKWIQQDFQQSSLTTPKFTTTEELEKQIADLNEQNAFLKRELDLSEVRVRNIEAVLRLQEKNLCASKSQGGGKVLVDSESLSKSERLLTGWRSQVLRLLIQIEQYKADLAHAIGETHRKTADFEQCKQAVIVEQEALELKTKALEAAVTSAKQQNEMLSKQLAKEAANVQVVQNKFVDLHENIQLSLRSIHASVTELAVGVRTFLHSDSDSHRDTSNSTSFAGIFHRLRHLERRLTFAVGRFPVLRTRLSSRRAVSVEQFDRALQTQSVFQESVGGPLSVLELEELLSHANAESQRLREERDLALSKLEHNSKTFQQRLQAAQDEVQMEIVNLHDTVRTLKEQLDLKNQELAECHAQLDNLKTSQMNLQQQTTEECTRLQTQYTESQTKLAQARAELHRTERRLKRVLDERQAELNVLERSCGSKLERLKPASQAKHPSSSTDHPVTPPISGHNHTLGVVNASGITSTSEQFDALAKSLQHLSHLVARLNSDSSEGSGDEHEGL